MIDELRFVYHPWEDEDKKMMNILAARGIKRILAVQ